MPKVTKIPMSSFTWPLCLSLAEALANMAGALGNQGRLDSVLDWTVKFQVAFLPGLPPGPCLPIADVFISG